MNFSPIKVDIFQQILVSRCSFRDEFTVLLGFALITAHVVEVLLQIRFNEFFFAMLTCMIVEWNLESFFFGQLGDFCGTFAFVGVQITFVDQETACCVDVFCTVEIDFVRAFFLFRASMEFLFTFKFEQILSDLLTLQLCYHAEVVHELDCVQFSPCRHQTARSFAWNVP